jgi:hypothetical protein
MSKKTVLVKIISDLYYFSMLFVQRGSRTHLLSNIKPNKEIKAHRANSNLYSTLATCVAKIGTTKPTIPLAVLAKPEYDGTREIEQNSQTTIIPDTIPELRFTPKRKKIKK